MGLNRLKSIRVGLSVLFFVLTAFLFLDFWNSISPSVAGAILYLQFVPSLLKFLTTGAAGATGFIAVVILTVLFGRVYCSTICPLGTLQDVIGVAARKNGKRRRFRWSKPRRVLRYSILSLTVLLLLGGSGFVLNLLDPFSSFGRIFSNLVRPLVLLVNNVTAAGLEHFNIHTLYQVRWAVIAPLSAGIAVLTLAVVAWLSAGHGRLYCNTVCPVGALLGLLSRVSLFRVGIDPENCLKCRLCESVCKAGCIDTMASTIDVTRCVACYNCFTVCNMQALRFEYKQPWHTIESLWTNRHRVERHMPRRSLLAKPEGAARSEKRSNQKGCEQFREGCNAAFRPEAPFIHRLFEARPKPGRRGFMLNSVLWVAGIAGLGEPAKNIIQSRPTSIPVRLTSPVSPPGSASIAHFISTCTACHLCVSACPSRVLVPSFLEFGFLGMMQPRLDFQDAHCNYDCTICTNICPSGALFPLAAERKKLTQLGVAKFIKENCVVHTDRTSCGACSEHCPTKAVSMVPYPNPANPKLVIPEVNEEYCIGCGGCEHACPTKPFKAIYVDGNPVHRLAKKPVVQKVDDKVDYEEDFPF
ncbi:MAG: 4Fe-4S dicluster domain-containing protein [Desulfobacterales bacterium]